MNNSLTIDVGMTDRGLEDIGDIQCYKYIDVETVQKQSAGAKENINTPPLLRAGIDSIVEIEWNAHLITEADELYHTVWETVSKTTQIVSPVDGYLEDINTSALKKKKIGKIHVVPAFDSCTTLFSMITNQNMIQLQMKDLCCEDEYEEIVGSSERGLFFDADAA